jgi:hypothetical protein
MRFLADTVYHSCLIVLWLLALAAGTASAETIPLKNHSPVWFGLLFPEPDSASTVEAGKLDTGIELDYSNIFFLNSNSSWITKFDMELTQLTLDARFGTRFSGVEAGLRQPFYYAGGGFMDSYILDFHEAAGFSDYPSQRAAPRNRYLYFIDHNGLLWNAPAPYRITPGDTSIWVKKEFFKTDFLLSSLKLIAQPPIASTSTGFGNGAWETSLVILADIAGDIIDTTINAGMVDPGFIDRGEKQNLNRFMFAHAAFSYRYSNRLSLIVQGSVAASPYGDPLPERFQRTWREITFGLTYITRSKRKISLAFLEDLSKTAPDITLHLSSGI